MATSGNQLKLHFGQFLQSLGEYLIEESQAKSETITEPKTTSKRKVSSPANSEQMASIVRDELESLAHELSGVSLALPTAELTPPVNVAQVHIPAAAQLPHVEHVVAPEMPAFPVEEATISLPSEVPGIDPNADVPTLFKQITSIVAPILTKKDEAKIQAVRDVLARLNIRTGQTASGATAFPRASELSIDQARSLLTALLEI